MTNPQLITLADEKKLIGLEVRTTNALEADPTTARIPGLYQRFFAENVEANIPQRLNAHLRYAAYTHYASDHRGEYTLIVGAETDALDHLPAGLTGATRSPGRYLLFAAHGPMPQVVVETWQHIWMYFASTAEDTRAYTLDFERYDQNDPSKVEIYIAV